MFHGLVDGLVDILYLSAFYVFNTYAIENMSFFTLSKTTLLSPYVPLLLCLQSPCSSVSHKSPTPLGAPLSVGEGLGVGLGLGEAFFPNLLLVQGVLHSPLLLEKGRG